MYIGCACVLSAKMCSTTLGALSMDWKRNQNCSTGTYIILYRIETFCCEHPLLSARQTPINCLSSHLFFISLRLRLTTVTNAAAITTTTVAKAITVEQQQNRLKNCKEVDTNVCCHLSFLSFCSFCRWAGANCTAIFCHLCRFFVSIFFSFHARPVLTHEYFIYLLRCNFFPVLKMKWENDFSAKTKASPLKGFLSFF